MINFREALRKVSTKQYKLAVEKIPVSLCVGSVLAETIIAPIGLPIFNNSAVDGFAVDYRLLYKASLTSPKKLVIG